MGVNATTMSRLAPLPPLPRQKLPALPELSEIKYSKSPPVSNSKYQGLGGGNLVLAPGSTKGSH